MIAPKDAHMENYRIDNLFIDATVAELKLPPQPKAASWIFESYSQYGEDRIMLALLRAQVCDRESRSFQSIKYIEIGGNHPVRNSNTWLLYKLGCSGTLVEANPKLASLLSQVRPRDQVVPVAVVPDAQERVLLHLGKYDELSSLRADHIESFGDFNGLGGIERAISVPAININTLLEQTPDPLDYLSIDVEGLDVDLLEALDFARFQPAFIQAEPSEHFLRGNTNRMIDVMQRNNYVLLARTEGNCIFRENSL